MSDLKTASGGIAGQMIPNRADRPRQQDDLNAFCAHDNTRLMPSDKGPLSGLSFGVKDVFAIEGTTIGFGHPDWLRTHCTEKATAELVAMLTAAGAAMIGKTISDELCYSLSGSNYHYGNPKNVRAPGRLTGGSSSGSAAAVAAGYCDFALGTDCGGSIRVPASYCGLFGIRSSHGRLSTHGVAPFAPSFDVPGWFADDARTFARVGEVVFGADARPRASRGRIVFIEDGFAMLDRHARDAFARYREVLGSIFRETLSYSFGEDELDRWRQVFQTIQGHEIWTNLGDWVLQTEPTFGPGVRERFANASRIPAPAAAAARIEREAIVSVVKNLIAPGDVLCLPTTPHSAPAIDAPNDMVELAYRNRAMSLLCIAGLTGFPQVSIPVDTSNHPPIGISLIGGWGDDEYLLALAGEIAEAAKNHS